MSWIVALTSWASFVFLCVGCSCSSRFFVIRLHFLKDHSNWSPPSCSTTFQNVLSSSDLLSQLSKLLHHKKLWSKFSTLLVSSLNLTPSYSSRGRLVECCFCRPVLNLISFVNRASFFITLSTIISRYLDGS